MDPELLDPMSVEIIEGRSPRWSTMDRDHIMRCFETGSLFSCVSDTRARSEMVQRTLAIERTITSLFTYLEDTKYLEPAALALKHLLPPHFDGTICQQLRGRYTGDRGKFELGYRSLWLFTIRFFPSFGVSKPLLDGTEKGKLCIDWPWAKLAKLAKAQGFYSEEIQKFISEVGTENSIDLSGDCASFIPSLVRDDLDQWAIKRHQSKRRRCGKPTLSAFQQICPALLFENVYSAPPVTIGLTLTPFAVAKDVVHAFLPCPKHPCDTSPKSGVENEGIKTPTSGETIDVKPVNAGTNTLGNECDNAHFDPMMLDIQMAETMNVIPVPEDSLGMARYQSGINTNQTPPPPPCQVLSCCYPQRNSDEPVACDKIQLSNLPTIKETNLLVHVPTMTVYHCSKPALKHACGQVSWFAIKSEKKLVCIEYEQAARAIEQGIVYCGNNLADLSEAKQKFEDR